MLHYPMGEPVSWVPVEKALLVQEEAGSQSVLEMGELAAEERETKMTAPAEIREQHHAVAGVVMTVSS